MVSETSRSGYLLTTSREPPYHIHDLADKLPFTRTILTHRDPRSLTKNFGLKITVVSSRALTRAWWGLFLDLSSGFWSASGLNLYRTVEMMSVGNISRIPSPWQLKNWLMGYNFSKSTMWGWPSGASGGRLTPFSSWTSKRCGKWTTLACFPYRGIWFW